MIPVITIDLPFTCRVCFSLVWVASVTQFMSAVHVCSPCLLLEEEAGHSGDKMTCVNLSAFGLQGAEEGKATVRI